MTVRTLLSCWIDVATSRPVAIALWLVCAGLLLLDLWGLSLFRGVPNYQAAGTWGSWVSSATALVAVAIAMWGNQMTQTRYLKDKQEKEDREVTEISAWTELSTDERGTPCLDLIIHNSTGHPITTWNVDVSSVGLFKNDTLGPITPGDNRFALPTSADERLGSLPCVLSFTDRYGRPWRTSATGGKEQL